jgi:hypothetical protein
MCLRVAALKQLDQQMTTGGCVSTNRFDHLTLVVADAERSLEGLQHSLQGGSDDMMQGALHCRDLSGALSILGLDTAASLIDDVARQMTLGQPSVIDVANGLLPVVSQVIKDIQLGQVPNAEQQLKLWEPWLSRLQVLVTRDSASLSNFEAVMPKAVGSQLVGAADPGFKALRLKGLSLIQNARIVNQRDDERTVRQIDALLSELQDWSLRVGQVPLAQLFPLSAHELVDIWLDATLLEQLDALRDFGAKAESIKAQSRSLTIHMDWVAPSLSQEDYVQIGECLQKVAGHIKRTPEGFRLVFPCSLSRMRMMPFMRNGQRYVAAAGQFVQFQPDSEDAGFTGTLMLRAGIDNQNLQVDRMLPAENMNVFEVPQGIDRPEGVCGVALDGTGEIYYFLGPQ